MRTLNLGRDVRALVFLFAAVLSLGLIVVFAQAEAPEDDRACGDAGCVDTSSMDAAWVPWYEMHGGDADLFARIWSPEFIDEEGPLGEPYCAILESLFGISQRLHWMNTKGLGNLQLLELHGSNLWSIATRAVDLECEWAYGYPTWNDVLGYGIRIEL